MLDSTRLAHLKQKPLWDFALDVYRRPGIEAACLQLQDEQEVDVCELLFHCWLYCHGLAARQEPLRRARESQAEWQSDVTRVVKALRRRLKEPAQHHDDIARLRAMVKEAELQAERVTLQRWQVWAWEAQEPEPRLMDITTHQQNAASWLQSQVFSLPFADSRNDKDALDLAANSAWAALAGQLDPLKLAR